MQDLRAEYAGRLHDLWMAMIDCMSQGGQHSICVNPEMVEDIRAAEFLARCYWKSIESAPRDGTIILGHWINGEEHTGSICNGRWVPAWESEDESWDMPTHWMAIPPVER